jgi:hypothetical protein
VNYFAVTIAHQHIMKLACLRRYLAFFWCDYMPVGMGFVSIHGCVKLSPDLLRMLFLSKCRSFQKVVGIATTALVRFVGSQLVKRRFQHSQLSLNVNSVEMHVKFYHPFSFILSFA